MARTLGQMKAIALDMADVTGDPHIVDARLTDWFNLELAALSDLLVSSEENYFCQRRTYPLVLGVQSYDLPRNYYHTLKMYYLPNLLAPLDRRSMARLSLDELGGRAVACQSLGAPAYCTVGTDSGTQVVLSRTDAAGGFELWYVPQFTDLQTDSQRISPSVPNGYEDWVMLGVAVRARVKEESDTTQLEAKRREVLQRIMSLMSSRDHGEALQVTDYYATHDRARYVGWRGDM